MKAVGQKEEGLKEKQKGLKGAHNCLDCMEVFGHPRPNYAQLRMGDKLQEESVKKKAEEAVATLAPLHPAELDARWPPVDPSRYSPLQLPYI